jgi:hypothetical protein
MAANFLSLVSVSLRRIPRKPLTAVASFAVSANMPFIESLSLSASQATFCVALLVVNNLSPNVISKDVTVEIARAIPAGPAS